MVHKIALMKGDGIGAEVMEAALQVLGAIQERFQIEMILTDAPGGDITLTEEGSALPPDSLQVIRDSDALLKGPVGESALDVIVKLRQDLDLFANLRPLKALPHIPSFRDDIDLLIVRENTEGLYVGMEFEVGDNALALRLISRGASVRIAEYAFKMASRRRKKIVMVHKANVLRKTDGLFSNVVKEVSTKFPQVELESMYVDACAMNLIRNPESFDVIVTTNMFGDILSDEAAQLVGGLGVAPSANIGTSFGLFEPVHGAAPDIAGKGQANPIAMILSMKMMLSWFGESREDDSCNEAASAVEKAVINTLQGGIRTPELGGTSTTNDVGKAISSSLLS